MVRLDNALYTRGYAEISVLGGIMTGVSLTSDHLGKILEVKSAFAAESSVAAMGNMLKKMGMARKRPRPMHYNSSSEVMEDSK